MAKHLIFSRNLTTNSEIDFSEYDSFFISNEIYEPLSHLPEYIRTLCNANSSPRLSFVSKCVTDLEKHLGHHITRITQKEIDDSPSDTRFNMYLAAGETTSLRKSSRLQITQPPQYPVKIHTFSAFFDSYSHIHISPSPSYAPRTEQEKECYSALLSFLTDRAANYETNRNKILSSGSLLSPYISLGVIPFEHLIAIVQSHAQETSAGYQEFLRQCNWVLYCKLKASANIDTSIPKQLSKEEEQLFLQWREGMLREQDEIDVIINSNMQKLKAGQMVSNRFRLMNCYYLVKKLGIDWRYGEYYFRYSLLDAHPLINFYNWHWQCTRNRFFNSYNLYRQAKLYS